MTNNRFLPLAVSGAVFCLDRFTKVLVERNFQLWDTVNVIPGFFNLVHASNRGAAFGMFADSTSPIRAFLLIGVSTAVLVFVSVLLISPTRAGFAKTLLTTLGLSLVLGGAMGNMYDRIVSGSVTDFLEFFAGEYRFAAFNVADSAITIGAACLILDMWRTRQRAVPAEDLSAPGTDAS